MSFPVLHDDDDLLAVSKPAGVNTHRPGRSALAGIFEWLKAHGGAWSALSLPHRLDRETSGVLVFGKSRRANRSLAGQFAAGSVERVYELLSGAPGPPSGARVDSPIRLGTGASTGAAGAPGALAATLFMTLGHRSGLALIRARPLTGRTHQVRIHAARLGCPVLGDRIHGAAPIDAPWPHLMLHARQLTLLHPGTGERLTLDAPRPGCFEAVWQGERDPAELARLAVDDRRAALFFAGTMKSAQLPPVG